MLGRISIHQIVVAVNKLAMSRTPRTDPEDDLGVVIGMEWLSVDKQVCSALSIRQWRGLNPSLLVLLVLLGYKERWPIQLSHLPVSDGRAVSATD